MITYIPYLLLCFVVLSIWIAKKRSIILGLIILVLLSGIILKSITFLGLFWVLLLGLFIYSLSRDPSNSVLKVLFTFGTVIISLGLFSHQLPGFNNLIIFKSIQFSENSSPFTMYLNLDKPFVGILLLFFLNIPKSGELSEFLNLIKKNIFIFLLLLTTIMVPAYFLNYIFIDPKLPSQSLVWIINNLFIVCVTEEVFFRGFIQGEISKYLINRNHQAIISIMLSSLLFGLAHFKGGITYIFLSFIAGLFYGYAFYKTQKIESSILIHFLLNLTHFLFFTYPTSLR